VVVLTILVALTWVFDRRQSSQKLEVHFTACFRMILKERKKGMRSLVWPGVKRWDLSIPFTGGNGACENALHSVERVFVFFTSLPSGFI